MTWDEVYAKLDNILTEIEDDDLLDEEKVVKHQNTTLYAIKDTRTGDIIFNANKGPYKDPIKAVNKLNNLKKGHPGRYKIVKYVLMED